MDELKVCGRCRQEKAAPAFYVIKARLSTYCRECQLAYMASWRQRHLAVERKRDREYYARTKDRQAVRRKEKWAATPPDERKAQLARLAIWNRAHPEANAARQLRWRRDNPERAKAAQARWLAKPESKAKRAALMRKRRALTSYQVYDNLRRCGIPTSGPPITLAQWTAILKAFDDRCAYCGCRPYKPTMEHMTPTCRGGEHVMGNVVPACQPCNSSKGKKTLAEFCARRGLDAAVILAPLAAVS
jgi:5-methylcytosine-specific restriction endonuclease McrA